MGELPAQLGDVSTQALLIATGLSYVEALRTRQGFKSPPGAADNERKRLSLLPRTLRPRRLVPSAGSLPYQAYSAGYVHTRRLLLPHGPAAVLDGRGVVAVVSFWALKIGCASKA